MHLILMTEAAQGGTATEAPPDGQLEGLVERWNPLMTRLVPQWSLQEEDDALNTLAERARAQLVWGRTLNTEDDGRLPLEAWDLGDCSGTPWARLSPFHGLVGSDRITLLPPAELRLSEVESRQLFAAVQPLFATEGVRLEWHDPLHWRVQHDSLQALPCASLARAAGDSVQRWQGRTPLAAARLLRRLQNEAQMVLHDHPVNRARDEQGLLTVNSLWLDHAGAADTQAVGSQGQAREQALRSTVLVEPLVKANSALQAWVDAALPAPPDSESEPVLVLCGRHGAQAFTMRRLPSGWLGALQRTLKRPPRTRSLSSWLQTLDAPAHEAPR